MIFIEGPRVFSPFPSGLGVARPRSEPRLLCCPGHFAWSWPVRSLSDATGHQRCYAAAGSEPRLGRTRACSAETDGLLLGLDHGHDALVSSRVGRTGVLRAQPVDDLPRRVAVDPLDDPPTDDNGLER